MINNISISNLKGLNANFNLTPLTAIVGPNYSGKTAIADAIKVGLLGYHPDLGKTNQATFRLASADRMSVVLEFNDGDDIDRTWELRGKTVKYAGSEARWPSAILNIAEFIAANAKERLRMVSGSDEAVGKAAARLKHLIKAPVSTFEELDARAEGFEKMAAAERASARRFEGMLQGTAIVDASAKPAPQVDVKAAIDKVTALAAELHAAQDTLEDLERREQAADMAAEELDADPITMTEAEIQERIAAIDADRERLREEIDAAGRTAHAVYKEVEDRSRWLKDAERIVAGTTPESVEAEITRIQALPEVDANREGGLLDAATGEWRRAEENLRHAEAAAAKAANERVAVSRLSTCPVCLASAPGWRETVERHLDQALREANEAKAAAFEHLEMHRKIREDQAANFQAASDVQRQRNRLPDLEAQRKAHAEMEDLVAALTLDQNRYDAIQGKLTKCRAKVATLTTERADLARTNAKLIGERTLRAAVAGRPSQATMNMAAGRCVDLEGKLENARREQQEAMEAADAATRESERQKNMRQARENVDDAKAKAEEHAKNAAEIRQVMNEEMAGAFQGIVDAAAHFSESVLGGPLVLKDGEIGRWVGPAFVPFEALSGTEQLVATAAIQVGLQDGQPFKLLLLDELSRMDHDHKREFAERLKKAVAEGIVDQVIVLDHSPHCWHSGFTLIATGACSSEYEQGLQDALV